MLFTALPIAPSVFTRKLPVPTEAPLTPPLTVLPTLLAKLKKLCDPAFKKLAKSTEPPCVQKMVLIIFGILLIKAEVIAEMIIMPIVSMIF